MIRKIIQIDREKCNGCGLCVTACHEGALGIEDGKAVLLRDDYCDGLGACLPVCPMDALSFIEREALAYDEEAVLANQAAAASDGGAHHAPAPSGCPVKAAHTIERPAPQGGCPGKMARALKQPAPQGGCPGKMARAIERPATAAPAASSADPVSELAQWPVQIQLVPVNAPYFDGARLLIAADCAAYAYAGFHERFMRGRITIIGCPKLDDTDYSEKLTAILKHNNIASVTIARMEVPCCAGLANAAVKALQNCGKMIPWQIAILSTDGQIIEQ